MKFNSNIDLSRQSHIDSTKTAVFDGSISLKENLEVEGEVTLTGNVLVSEAPTEPTGVVRLGDLSDVLPDCVISAGAVSIDEDYLVTVDSIYGIRINNVNINSDASPNNTIQLELPSGSSRYDIIYVNSDGSYGKVTGTPATSPSVPLTPNGTIVIAQVFIFGGGVSSPQIEGQPVGGYYKTTGGPITGPVTISAGNDLIFKARLGGQDTGDIVFRRYDNSDGARIFWGGAISSTINVKFNTTGSTYPIIHTGNIIPEIINNAVISTGTTWSSDKIIDYLDLPDGVITAGDVDFDTPSSLMTFNTPFTYQISGEVYQPTGTTVQLLPWSPDDARIDIICGTADNEYILVTGEAAPSYTMPNIPPNTVLLVQIYRGIGSPSRFDETIVNDKRGYLPLVGGELFGDLKVLNGNNIYLKAASGLKDSGDLIFLQGDGTETGRLYMYSYGTIAEERLIVRFGEDGENPYDVIHAGNYKAFLKGTYFTLDTLAERDEIEVDSTWYGTVVNILETGDEYTYTDDDIWVKKLKFSAGTFTPTSDVISGAVTDVTPNLFHYSRIGDEVSVQGSFVMNTPSSGQVSIDLSLPIASEFTDGLQCSGIGSISSAVTNFSSNVRIGGSTGSNAANVSFNSPTGGYNVYVSYMYSILT